MQRVHNKAILACLVIAVAAFSGRLFACIGNCPSGVCSLASVTFAIPESVITADTLAILLKSGNVSLIECRGAGQTTDLRIPGAMVIRDDVVIASITEQLPARDRMLIIYPGVEGGNIDAMIAELRKQGYRSILKFQAGIQGWLTYGYHAEGEGMP